MIKYLLISLINATYGVLLLVTLTKDTPGFAFVLTIASLITLLGVIGFGLWLKNFTQQIKGDVSESAALKGWFQVAKGIDVLLIIGLLFRAFILQPFVVDGNSMEPNYHDKEYLLVDQITYRFRVPKRGEVIIFRFPKQPDLDYIKRIIALPGETVKIEDSLIYVNNERLQEQYLPEDEQTIAMQDPITPFEKTLSTNEYFVLGDNRSHSSDSREWGAVPKQNIIGRAWLVIYPLSQAGLIRNPVLALQHVSATLQ